jgi:urea transporter
VTTETYYCARHPNVETLLRCGRCEALICPRCVVMTDVGARCPDCAPRRKLPQFEIGPIWAARGLAAAVAAGAVLGAAWGLLLPGAFGFFIVFVGIGLGYGVAEPVSLATNRKIGTVLGVIAAAGVVLAYLVRNVVDGAALLRTDDLYGYIAVGVGVVVAFNRLRI